MAVRICHATHDERNKYHGGEAGNQGSELATRLWYSRPWDTVLRANDALLALKIAEIAEKLVSCKKIGYDQYQRTTLWNECEKIGWNINRLNDIAPCECDCSSLIAVILHFCGVIVSKDIYTGNLTAALLNTGKFACLRDSKYLTSDRYIKTGDILLNTAHHVAVAIDDGSMASQTSATVSVNYAGIVTVSDYLNVRQTPNGSGSLFYVAGAPYRLPNGMVVAICQERDGWGRLSDIQGWVSLEYVKR